MHSYPYKGAEWPFVWEIEKYHIGLAFDILLIVSSHAISEGRGSIVNCGLGGDLLLSKK